MSDVKRIRCEVEGQHVHDCAALSNAVHQERTNNLLFLWVLILTLAVGVLAGMNFHV